LSGPFAQLLRYTAPADARSTTVRLRSAGTASPLSKAYWGRLALEQNSSLKMKGLRTEGILEVKGQKNKRKKGCVLGRNETTISI